MVDERLVPIWVREYVEWKLDQRLGSRAALQRAMRALDAANQHVKILEADRDREPYGFRARIAHCLRSCAETIMENRLDSRQAMEYLEKYAATVETQGQPAGGPHTPDLAAHPDSNTEKPRYPYTLDATTWPIESPFQPIGVHDYDSLVACLRENFKLAFGENALFFRDTDPQDMIQRMAAEIQNLKRLKGGSVQGLESEVRVPTAEDGPE